MAGLTRRSCCFVLPVAIAVGVGVLSAQAPSSPAMQATRSIADYPGLARVFRDVSATVAAGSVEQAAAGLFDFEQVVAAVTGRAAPAGTMPVYRDAFAGKRPLTVEVDRSSLARDDTAYKLHSLGYSAKEIADILAGRITRAALDNAQKMLMLGSRPEQVSDFLDREYGRLRAERERVEQRERDRERERPKKPAPRPAPPARQVPSPRRVPPPATLAAQAQRFATAYGVDPALARAVIACESGWNPDARSKVGAIGLMQLMPGTARELGIDPRDPVQNLEGGIRYLAGLLRAFASIEQALVAYNAGPGFAARYARGQAALYGETREFVQNVLAHIAAGK